MAATYSATTGTTGRAGVWTAIVTIAGVDVSSKIVGEIRVDAEEGSARIAEITIKPTTGTSFAISAWVGKSVSVDIADNASGSAASVARLFSGVIDTPTLDLASHMISLRCTDNLQNVLEAMTLAEIDAAIPSGYDSPVIFDPAARGWSRAQDRLSTVGASLDLTTASALRLTSWAPKAVADLAFTGTAHVLDGSVSVSLASRSQLINQVDIDFGYRFPRVKAEGHPITFTYVSETSFASYVTPGNWFLQRLSVESAIKSAGGTIESISYTPLPNVAIAQWVPGPYDGELCMGFTGLVSFDYAQTTEEQHDITVSTPASIAVVGALTDRLSGALVGEYPPIVAVENAMTLYKNGIVGVPPQDVAAVVSGYTTAANVTLTTGTDRAAADAAMQSLIATAKVKIWAAHRQNSVSAAVALNPAIDLGQTIQINDSGVAARGKCRSVTHRLSPDTGRAVSEFAIAICSIAGTGVAHADSPITAPVGSNPTTSALTDTPTVVFLGGVAEDHSITITFPQVADAQRNRAVVPLLSSYSAAITEDLFTLTL